MTVPAYAGAAKMPHGTPALDCPAPRARWDLAQALTALVRDEELPDSSFRFYVRVVMAFGDQAFTAQQAADVADVELMTAWQVLGRLASHGLFSVRRAIVGENAHGRPVRARIYRAQAVHG